MTSIITHRGFDSSKNKYFTESSCEAFEDHLVRGFGLEFDLQITKDNKIIILHDSTLSRISEGKDRRKICEITAEEILSMRFNQCRLVSFDALLRLIQNKQTLSAISAIHLKNNCQDRDVLNIILSYLEHQDVTKFIMFDVKLETAVYLKEKSPDLSLAPSIAHPFDIERYNYVTGGTLMSIDEVLDHPELFSWVWLDEWDTTDRDGGAKLFYTKELFNKLHDVMMKIALVSPELHATSPGLLGGESHPDASNQERLFTRIEEIIKLKPDAICTDYPDLVKIVKNKYL